MIQHYLVLKDEGIPLYSFTNKLSDPHYTGSVVPSSGFNPSENSVLFSGLISSFVKMSNNFGGSLKQVKMDNVDIYLYEHNGLIGVSLADPTDDKETSNLYKNHTQQIVQVFHNVYKDELNNFTGNISIFDDFQNHFSENFEDSTIKPGETCKSCLLRCVSKQELKNESIN